MSEATKRKAYAFLREECANHFGGNCILLETTEYAPCPQLHSNSLICKYFRDAVLPADKLLHAEVMGEGGMVACTVCGKPFRALSNRAKYCERCGKIASRDKARERKQRQRESCGVNVTL